MSLAWIALELGTRQLGGLIQVQAPLYPGDSGAAVVDVRGAWLGLIRGGLAIPGSGPDADAEPAPAARADGVDPDDDRDTDFGFAIPTRDALWVADQLRTHGYVDRAYLGVRIELTLLHAVGPLAPPVEPATAPTGPGEAGTMPAPTAAGDGARVSEVLTGTPAATAGLRPGDRIIALDGQAIRSHHELIDRLDRLPAQITIILSIVRGDGRARVRIEVSLHTASRPDATPGGPSPARSPTVTVSATPRANVPVTPTASRAAPAEPAPAPPEPVPAASPPSRPPAPEPATTYPSHSDRPTRRTPNPAVSIHELRHTLPQAFVERMDRLEQRLDRLETTSNPTPGPDMAAQGPTPPRTP